MCNGPQTLLRHGLTSLFTSGMIAVLAFEEEVIKQDRWIEVRMLVWTLVRGFTAHGEVRSMAGYRRP